MIHSTILSSLGSTSKADHSRLYWRCALRFLWFVEITCVKDRAFITVVLNSQFPLSRFGNFVNKRLQNRQLRKSRVSNCFVFLGSASNVLYQDVYIRLNLINFAVIATPPPCTTGSGTVCPVRAGDSSRYTAVVTFSEELPPVRHILSL